MDFLEFHEKTMTLEKGDVLVMFTDGVTEAFDTSFEQYGDDRLQDTLQKVAQQGCRQLIDSVRADVAAFVGEAEQSDDITIMALKRR
jgi:sigma-B regulation protein RsbU (phosphoserine phosphatase)